MSASHSPYRASAGRTARGLAPEADDIWLGMLGVQDHDAVVLKEDVADWCWDNIGPYRMAYHFPNESPKGATLMIEFKSVSDMTLFKLRWL